MNLTSGDWTPIPYMSKLYASLKSYRIVKRKNLDENEMLLVL